MSEDPKTKVKGSVELDITGKVAVSGEVSGFPAIVNAFRSPKAKIQHAAAERIASIIRTGGPIDGLSPFDQALLIEATGDTILKAMNKAEVVKRALAHEPNLAGLLVASGATEAQEPTKKAAEEADEQLLFWERFWADAESVSVEYMQEIYARILAGKTKKPKGFSLKTLEVLRYLDSRTAAVLKAVGAFAFAKRMVPDIFSIERGYTAGHVRTLADSNLMSESPGTFPQNLPCFYHDVHIRFTSEEEQQFKMGPIVYVLTTAGRELLSMMELPTSTEHVLWNCQALADRDNRIEVCSSDAGPWVDWKEFYKDELATRATREAASAKSKSQ
jgi:uncharacterized protein DUF2806